MSMWRGEECVSSFRLAIEEVPELIEALREGLDRSYVAARPGPSAAIRHASGI